ncbi:Acyl-CoA dehydratase PaaZ [Cupriavidus necator]|uniref:Dehydratase n=1 Tax=Cupriavidus necator (strain ATCC 17699 / DSM 428 / KCTC 22496 / NCIMB 10442 / H16 / Stanier 337) TaxID=381666 RepID=Q0KC43_CUPNH|nr:MULTISPECIES: MaoC family dehydratase [Cupriavidus]EON21523.1 acyl dehydratase [Cupriavidus sp. GA3-3]KUE89839.1 dehydratase [Cupriavidus necator]QCC00319.1 dehydratase [Cupriavidus necator H16]QQB76863.1 MaoC family dehydratase [Cupriavidus necator]WKA42178.1 MaoC family dehydratase [Cupriavidus necator]
MSKLGFDQVKVGDTLPPLTLEPVNRTTLALFAGASNDHNPIHIDIDFARKAGNPDVFAHGMLAMAWLGRLLTQWVDQRQLRQFGVRFVGITHLGHRITCTGRVVEKLEVDGEKRVRLEIQTANQYGESKILGDAVVAL